MSINIQLEETLQSLVHHLSQTERMAILRHCADKVRMPDISRVLPGEIGYLVELYRLAVLHDGQLPASLLGDLMGKYSLGLDKAKKILDDSGIHFSETETGYCIGQARQEADRIVWEHVRAQRKGFILNTTRNRGKHTKKGLASAPSTSLSGPEPAPPATFSMEKNNTPPTEKPSDTPAQAPAQAPAEVPAWAQGEARYRVGETGISDLKAYLETAMLFQLNGIRSAWPYADQAIEAFVQFQAGHEWKDAKDLHMHLRSYIPKWKNLQHEKEHHAKDRQHHQQRMGHHQRPDASGTRAAESELDRERRIAKQFSPRRRNDDGTERIGIQLYNNEICGMQEWMRHEGYQAYPEADLQWLRGPFWDRLSDPERWDMDRIWNASPDPDGKPWVFLWEYEVRVPEDIYSKLKDRATKSAIAIASSGTEYHGRYIRFLAELSDNYVAYRISPRFEGDDVFGFTGRSERIPGIYHQAWNHHRSGIFRQHLEQQEARGIQQGQPYHA